jgi:hypothetical protein
MGAANEAIERTGQPAWNLEAMDEPGSAAEETRARTVDNAAVRLRRVERDLHDGTLSWARSR